MSRSVFMTGIPAFMGMLILILDSRCALESCREALLLCARTVIPSLFPFLFFSGLISQALWGSSGQAVRIAGWLLNIPSGAQSLVIPGFLGGYPAGAQAVADAYRAGRLEKQDAQKLLCFCNNAGPAFLFGMVGPMFPEKWMVWSLWGIHILSAAMTGMMYTVSAPFRGPISRRNISVSQNLIHSLKTIGIICGWIMLFRIGIGYLDRWILWMFPETIRVAIWGFLELSNGCCALAEIDSIALRFVICSAILSFGGVCVVMQTASVTEGLSTAGYLRGKLIQTVLSIVLAVCTVNGYGIVVLLFSVCVILFPKICKKEVAIQGIPVYNRAK